MVNVQAMSDISADAVWIKPDGVEPRLSDGSRAESALDTTAMHVLGWIEVQRDRVRTRVSFDPYAVRYDALMRFPHIGAQHWFRGRSIDVVLVRNGVAGSPMISFLDTKAAVEHVFAIVDEERGDIESEPPIDALAKGFRDEPAQERQPGMIALQVPQAQSLDAPHAERRAPPV